MSKKKIAKLEKIVGLLQEMIEGLHAEAAAQDKKAKKQAEKEAKSQRKAKAAPTDVAAKKSKKARKTKAGKAKAAKVKAPKAKADKPASNGPAPGMAS